MNIYQIVYGNDNDIVAYCEKNGILWHSYSQ